MGNPQVAAFAVSMMIYMGLFGFCALAMQHNHLDSPRLSQRVLCALANTFFFANVLIVLSLLVFGLIISLFGGPY